jgi:hypothetical protein
VTGHRIVLKNFRLTKGGKLERDQRRLSVSARLRQKGSQRVRVSKGASSK